VKILDQKFRRKCPRHDHNTIKKVEYNATSGAEKPKLIPDLDEDRLRDHIDIGGHLKLIENHFPRFKNFDRSPGRSILVSIAPFDFRIAALAK